MFSGASVFHLTNSLPIQRSSRSSCRMWSIRCVVLGAVQRVSKSAHRLSFLLRGLLSCMFLSFGFHPLASRAATFPQLPSLLPVSMSMVVAVFLAGECLLLSLLSEDDFTFDDDMLGVGYKYGRRWGRVSQTSRFFWPFVYIPCLETSATSATTCLPETLGEC